MSELTPMRHLIFEGMKHCGKSTHGRAVAQMCNWPFFDTDEMMIDGFERHFLSRPAIRDVYTMLGQEQFEKCENQIIRGLYQKLLAVNKRCVIALGGRVPLHPGIDSIIHAMGKVVYIRVPSDILYKRSVRRGPVPFLDQKNPQDDFARIYAEREPCYEKCADLIITLNDIAVGEAQKLVIAKVMERFGDYIRD